MNRHAGTIPAPLLFPESKHLLHKVCREAEWARLPRVQIRQCYGQECKPGENPNPAITHCVASAKRTTAQFRVVGKNVITQIDYKSMLSHTDITTTVGANIILPVLK